MPLDKKFLVVVVILVLIWISFFVFFYLKADEVTKDPCSICSKYMGEEVVCTTQTFIPSTKVYYPNGSVYTEQPKVNFPMDNIKLNLTINNKSN